MTKNVFDVNDKEARFSAHSVTYFSVEIDILGKIIHLLSST